MPTHDEAKDKANALQADYGAALLMALPTFDEGADALQWLILKLSGTVASTIGTAAALIKESHPETSLRDLEHEAEQLANAVHAAVKHGMTRTMRQMAQK